MEAGIARLRNSRNEAARGQHVLAMVVKGLTNKEIARVLAIGQFTVRNHVNHILEKLEASDRTEAVSIAIQLGIISIDS